MIPSNLAEYSDVELTTALGVLVDELDRRKRAAATEQESLYKIRMFKAKTPGASLPLAFNVVAFHDRLVDQPIDLYPIGKGKHLVGQARLADGSVLKRVYANNGRTEFIFLFRGRWHYSYITDEADARKYLSGDPSDLLQRVRGDIRDAEGYLKEALEGPPLTPEEQRYLPSRAESIAEYQNDIAEANELLAWLEGRRK